MNEERARLSGIETHWSIVRRAHDGNNSDARNAQALLMQQYGDAVRRYLIGALGSTDAADEVLFAVISRLPTPNGAGFAASSKQPSIV